jgi:hypothetical protein
LSIPPGSVKPTLPFFGVDEKKSSLKTARESKKVFLGLIQVPISFWLTTFRKRSASLSLKKTLLTPGSM